MSPSSSTSVKGDAPGTAATRNPDPDEQRYVPVEFAFLRFVAGARALLATVVNVALLALPAQGMAPWQAAATAYMAWATLLLWLTLKGRPVASWSLWVWVDAAVVVLASHLAGAYANFIGTLIILPVVAMALRAGALQSTVLAAACLVPMLAIAPQGPGLGSQFVAGLLVAVLAVGPGSAILARPSRELLQRLQVQHGFHQRADPRQGLRHHVEVLLDLLGAHFCASHSTICLRGLEPRVFRWLPGAGVQVLAGEMSDVWEARIDALPRSGGCLWLNDRSGTMSVRVVDLVSGRRLAPGTAIGIALQNSDTYGLALPLKTYGQPLGLLCIERADRPFTTSELKWVHQLMREAVPLLERSDLLEQLERETALRERERIGRDLHDSAVQPYLGLKYGLEALARRAGNDNPLSEPIAQMLKLAHDELENLRDVVSGLRRGHDPAAESASLAALQRQAQRFEALFGLKVTVFAQDAAHLRGSLAKAILHMVNEALTNVRRHTTATAVTVLVDVLAAHVLLRLRNDHGAGEMLPEDFVPRSLTERARDFAGSVSLAHEANFTEITISLPITGRQR